MENTLMIDCSAGMNLILKTENEIFKFLDSNQKRHTDELLLSVDKLLSDANLKIGDIKNFCVAVGPGSFTGIRVAIAITKGLAIGNKAKIFTASNFDIYSFGENSNSIYILDGFSDFIYTRVLNESSCVDNCEHILDFVEKIKSKYQNYNVFVQSEKIQNILKENGIDAKFLNYKIIDIFTEKIENNDFTEINMITPIYLRASQAEIERNKKLEGNL